MAGFLKKIFGGDSAKGKRKEGSHTGVRTAPEPLKIAQLAELIDYYPLGSKIYYYPEFQQDCELETLVLGYGVDKHFIFSPANIAAQQASGIDGLRVSVDGQQHLLNKVDRFCVMIPFNEDDDNKRGYARRAELGPRGPFSRNNTITLVTSTGSRMVTIDTVVRKIQPLEGDIYAGYKAVLLDVLPSTLKLVDQRQQYRLPTHLPAQLAVKDGNVHPCTLLDYSEGAMRLHFERSHPELQSLSQYRRLTLTLEIAEGNGHKKFTLGCVMYRKSDTSMVVKLQGIYKDGEMQALNMVDSLDLKSSILRQPETQQALQEDSQA